MVLIRRRVADAALDLDRDRLAITRHLWSAVGEVGHERRAVVGPVGVQRFLRRVADHRPGRKGGLAAVDVVNVGGPQHRQLAARLGRSYPTSRRSPAVGARAARGFEHTKRRRQHDPGPCGPAHLGVLSLRLHRPGLAVAILLALASRRNPSERSMGATRRQWIAARTPHGRVRRAPIGYETVAGRR